MTGSWLSSQAERKEALNQLSILKAELGELEKELTQYGACDPVQIEEKQRAVNLAQEAAIRWTGRNSYLSAFSKCVNASSHTDNVSILMTYFTRQHSISASDVRQFLGIGEDFEEIC